MCQSFLFFYQVPPLEPPAFLPTRQSVGKKAAGAGGIICGCVCVLFQSYSSQSRLTGVRGGATEEQKNRECGESSG